MSSKTIVLTSSDDETFVVEEAVARQLQIVTHMIEDGCAGKAIPLRNVTGEVLAKVLEYCKTQVDGAPEAEDEEGQEAKKKKLVAPVDSTDAEDDKAKKKLGVWDAEFMKGLDLEMISKLIMAANYLNIQGLLDLTCHRVADWIKDKKVEEIREIFNIENDYTPEEEEALRKENEEFFNI